MLIGVINIAMQTSTVALQKGLDSARSSLAGFGRNMMSLKGLIAGSFAGAGIAALGHFAGLADDLSDNIERLGVMFGDSSDVIVAQSERMNAAFGTSEITFTAMATKMGGLFKALGVAEGPAAEMTNQLLVMGQAIANFKGISLEQAMGKIQAGMAGKGKGLKEFGISVSATMSAQERFNAIMQGGAGILETMDQRAMDAGASWKSLQGRIEELEISIGKNLPEMVEPFFAELNVLVVAAGDAFKGLKQSTLDWGEGSIEAGKASVESMGWVQKSIGFVADAWDVLRLSFAAVQSYITAGIGKIIGFMEEWMKAFDGLRELVGMGKGGAADFVKTWSEDLKNLSGKQWEGFQAKLAQPWPSDAVNQWAANARNKIAEARKEVTKGALGAVAKPGAVPAAMSGAKSAGAALSVGSAEATSAFIRTKYGIGEDNDMKKIARNSDKQVDLLDRLNKNLEAGDGAEMMGDFN